MEQQKLSLNFTDIADAVKVIDHACHGGAFRGWDTIRQVLGLRDKLQAFVEVAEAEMQAAQKAKESEVIAVND